MTTFHLYFDESGNFNLNDEYTDYSNSQLVGILVYASNNQSESLILDKLAKEILDNSYQKAYNQPSKNTYHGNELRTSENFNKFINNIIDNINKNDKTRTNWQPIRLVNKEKIGYGTTENNYLYMVAELVIRIVEQKKKEGFENIKLNIYPAQKALDKEYYENVVNSLLGVLKARQEFNFNLTNKIEPLPAQDYYLLQIADLLSNASYKDYNKCDENTAKKLQEFFNNYDFPLIVPLFSQRIDSLLKEEAYGLALRFILLEINSENNGNKAKEFLKQVINNLAKLPYSERNAHLNYLISWLEQEINQKRGLESGCKLAKTIEKNVYQKLVEKLSETKEENSLIWFKYALHYWALTGYNHSGKLVKASQEVTVLNQLQSQLYQQTEYLSLLMEGLVAKSVHYTDCFEFEKAIKETQFVIDFYDYFFGQEMKEFFSEIVDNTDANNTIKSDLRAKALGTCLQAQIYQYLQNSNSELLTKARQNSEKAIAEFVALNDKRRQYQYRSQLETVAGNFTAARQYLAKSLGLKEESSYLEIMANIKSLEENYQGFPLLHLFRLGYGCYLKNEFEEWKTFKNALQKSNLLNNPWFLTSNNNNYPIHGILRKVVSFALIMGDKQKAQQALGKLTNLKPITISPILGLIEIATYLEYAGLIWTGELTTEFNNIIAHNNREKVTITSLIGKLNDDNLAKVTAFKTQVLETITAIQNPKITDLNVKIVLLELGNKIGY